MLPDSSAIDAALTQRLAGDAALQGMLPGGVYFDVAPLGSTHVTILSLFSHSDTSVMGPAGQRRAKEEAVYQVEAITFDLSGDVADAAAVQIDTLLEDQPLTIVGYGCLSICRVSRVRRTTVDPVDQEKRWQHRGGRYRIVAAPQYT